MLPSDARQAEDSEIAYYLHLHAQVQLQDDSPDGKLKVIGSTDGREAVLMTVTLSHENGQPVLTSENAPGALTLGASPSPVTTTLGTQIDISGSNYLQYEGVVPGLNTLKVTTINLGVKLKSVVVFSDTAIEVSSVQPPNLKIEATDRERISVGQSVSIPYTIVTTDQSDIISTVDISTQIGGTGSPGDGLKLTGPEQETLTLNDGKASSSIEFFASSAGSFVVQLIAAAAGVGNVHTLVVDVTPARSTWYDEATSRWPFLVVFVVVLALFALTSFRIFRRGK